MAEKSFPWDSNNGDRKFKAEDFALPFALMCNNGIFANYRDELAVMVTSGMGIKIKTGSAIINGTMYNNTEELTKTLSLGNSLYNRIDRIVLRWDKTARKIDIQVLEGTPSSAPAKPPRITNDSMWDLVLADIVVPKGATSLEQYRIQDRRPFEAFCGWSTPFNQLKTGDLFAQYESLWQAKNNTMDTYFNSMKDKLTGDVGTNLTNIITEAEEGEASLKANLNNNYVKKGLYGIGGKAPDYTVSNFTGAYTRGDNNILNINSNTNGSRQLGVNREDRIVVRDTTEGTFVKALDEKNNIKLAWEDTAKPYKDKNGNQISSDNIIEFANGLKLISGYFYISKVDNYLRTYELPAEQQNFTKILTYTNSVIGNANPTLQFAPFKENGKWKIKALAMDTSKDVFYINFSMWVM